MRSAMTSERTMGRKGHGKLSPRRIAMRLNRQRAIQMRRNGYSLQEIADALGYASRSSVYNAIGYELKLCGLATAEGLRQLEEERLRQLARAIWPRVISGDCNAVGVYLKLSSQRSRLLGLDMPPKTAAQAQAAAKAQAKTIVIRLGAPQNALDTPHDEQEPMCSADEGSDTPKLPIPKREY